MFCTEPFRISLAGKLTVCCFDKTGTLTQDRMHLKGIVKGLVTDQMGERIESEEELEAEEGVAQQILAASGHADVVLAVLGVCHDLMPPMPGQNSQTVLGDPLELASLDASGFSFDTSPDPSRGGGQGKLTSQTRRLVNEERGLRLIVLRRFGFSSSLKRMSVLSRLVEDPVNTVWVLCKGAPEVLAGLIEPSQLPESYHATAFYHMSRGKRVLAVAFKKLTLEKNASPESLTREQVESALTFGGFLIFDCELKPDSRSVVKELKAAELSVVMITGDRSGQF